MLILFFKAQQFGLFDENVLISGHTTKRGTVVAPYRAKRKKRPEEANEEDLFATTEKQNIIFTNLDNKINDLPVKDKIKNNLKRQLSTFYRYTKNNTGNGKILALGMAKEWEDTNKISLLGQQANTPDELALIAQVYRNPGFETLRYILINKDGVVTHTTAISSRSPTSSAAYVGDISAFIDGMKKTIEETKSTGYYLLHNHPSGISSPSDNDLDFTSFMSEKLAGFKGHVIINSNEYTVIPSIKNKSGNTISGTPESYTIANKEDLLLKPANQHPILNFTIGSPTELANIASSLAKDIHSSAIIGTSGKKGKVKVVLDMPIEMIKNPTAKRSLAFFRRLASNAGLNQIFLAVPDSIYENSKLHELIKYSWVTDIVNIKTGKSLRNDNPNLSPRNNPYQRQVTRMVSESL